MKIMRDNDGWKTHHLIPGMRYRDIPDSDDVEIHDRRTDKVWICSIAANHCRGVVIESGREKGQEFTTCPWYVYDASTNTAYLLHRYDPISVVMAIQKAGSDPNNWISHDLVIRSGTGRDWL
jgi:hypothetical protein